MLLDNVSCHTCLICDLCELDVASNSFLRCCLAPLSSLDIAGTCGLSVTTFSHPVLNYYYLTVYIMFKPKMSLEGSVH